MPIQYPTTLDAFANPTPSSSRSNPSHAEQHSDANDAIEQLELKLGVGVSTPATPGHVLQVLGAGETGYGVIPDHAGAHATGSTDPLAPADIGAAEDDHNHDTTFGVAPGGELGGTWAAPTVDSVHAGSSHAASAAAAVAASGFLRFVPMTRVILANDLTTAVSIARALSGAIAGVPASAKAVSGYCEISSNGTPTNSNFLVVYQTEAGAADVAVVVRNNAASGLRNGAAFVAGVTQSGGAKLSFEVGRAANTITYFIAVTGYWTDAPA